MLQLTVLVSSESGEVLKPRGRHTALRSPWLCGGAVRMPQENPGLGLAHPRSQMGADGNSAFSQARAGRGKRSSEFGGCVAVFETAYVR